MAEALGISTFRVRQKRLAGDLWGIADGSSWLFPVMQFDLGYDGASSRVVRGFSEVFQNLPAGLHPVAIEGLFNTPSPDLFLDRPLTPLEWLRDGGYVDDAVTAAANLDWYDRASCSSRPGRTQYRPGRRYRCRCLTRVWPDGSQRPRCGSGISLCDGRRTNRLGRPHCAKVEA